MWECGVRTSTTCGFRNSRIFGDDSRTVSSSRLLDVKLDLKQTKEPGNMPISGEPCRQSSGQWNIPAGGPWSQWHAPIAAQVPRHRGERRHPTSSVLEVAVMMSLKHWDTYWYYLVLVLVRCAQARGRGKSSLPPSKFTASYPNEWPPAREPEVPMLGA